ncbi:MAG: hypothetical protein JNK68_04085 [Betaproteobacteria bacterium]|nr:hypothetical protein [Betaproteobacteria bacterium]
MNFSALEFESVLWLIQLSEQHARIKSFADTPFSARVRQLKGYVEDRSISAKWRRTSLRSWNDSLKLAIVRNHVAHNPLIFGWSAPTEVGEPDFIGIPNLRNPRSVGREWALSRVDADKCINDIVVVAKKLADLRIEWCKVRDLGQAPPARIHNATRWYNLRGQVASALRMFGIQ